MKQNSTLKTTFVLKSFLGLATFLFLSKQELHSQVVYSNENFLNLFNTSETAPVNTTFSGRTGTWTALSTDVKSTIAVKTDAGVSSTDLKFIMKANNLATISQNTATSPDVDLSMLTCSSKFDFFFDLFISNAASGNTGAIFQVQVFDGSSWNTIWSKSASQLLMDYGIGSWNTVGMLIPNSYMGMTNFKYRFITTNAAGNLTPTTLYVDNVRVLSYTCDATASVGNHVWYDGNENGQQDAGENGISNVTVKLAIAPGDTLTTITDGTGYYMFNTLAPAGYKLVFPNVAGMGITASNTCDDAYDSDIDPLTKTVTVFLAANESNTSIDAGYKTQIALPIKLISFTALLNNNSNVNLRWKTASEINVSHFIIERSIDGVTFSDAGMVFAAGNSTTDNDYTLSDNITSITSPVVYYRLRSQDIDGKSQLSEVRVVRLAKQGQQNSLSILTFPNPVTNELRITNPASWQNKNITYEIFSLNGQLVSKTVVAGASQTETANVSKLQSGIYMVKANCEGQVATQRIVKH
jgi:SdrD B-like domain/Secretion system C-terminal sorting domain